MHMRLLDDPRDAAGVLAVVIGNVTAWLDGLSATAVASFLTIVGGAAILLIRQLAKVREDHAREMAQIHNLDLAPRLAELEAELRDRDAQISRLMDVISVQAGKLRQQDPTDPRQDRV